MASRAIFAIGSIGLLLGIWFFERYQDVGETNVEPLLNNGNDSETATPQDPIGIDSEIFATEVLELELKSDIETALEKISPAAHDYYRDETRTYIQIVKGEIGSVDVDELKAGNLSSLVQLLTMHSDLTNATDDLDLELIELRQNAGSHSAIYRQRINGMPIDHLSSVAFSADGSVTRLRSLIVDPSINLIQPTILEAEAIAHAIGTLSNEMGYHIDDITVTAEDTISENFRAPALYYRLASEGQPPSPYWRVSMKSYEHGVVRTAKVNALTGETEILKPIQRFDTRICEQGMEILPTCEDGGG